jgi:hypothetical protein
MLLIDELLSLPVRGLMGFFKLQTPEEENMSDAEYLAGKLAELEVLRQMGDVSTQGYEERAAELHGRLDKARGLTRDAEVIHH